MSQPTPSARAAVDAIVARDRLQLSAEDYQRLVSMYDELQAELTLLRPDNIRDVEPAVVYTAT
jgi:hypothetical protein